MPLSSTTYEIAADGKSITCILCNTRSYNRNDVEKHFCGKCNMFHDDLWMQSNLTEGIREIFRRVHTQEKGYEQHGAFLRCFAEAMLRADPENFVLLTGPAMELIRKYHLLDNYVETPKFA